VHERRALSATSHDVDDILDLLEHMIGDGVKALLADLGEDSRARVNTGEMITAASTLIRQDNGRFVKDAPLRFLSQQVASLDQVLRDIGYLRQGYGRGGGRPRPDDMKWSHRHAIESVVLGTFSHVAEALRSDGGDVQRLRPATDIDLTQIGTRIVDLLENTVGAVEFMDAAIDLGESETGAAGWDAFRDLPYESELDRLASFFVDVVEKEPPATPLAGFFAEIAHPSRGGETVADLWLGGSSRYEPDVEEWFAHLDYTPRAGRAQSEVLAQIYRIAYAPGGLGNAAEYTVALAWAAYLARECARTYVRDRGLDRIGCRAGFSGGDWIELGWVEATDNTRGERRG